MPKKSLGQHWLFDKPILQAVVDAAEVAEDDTVLEIGPGLGTLTQLLVKSAKQVVAVEKDELLASDLKRTLPAANLKVITGDIMEFDLRTLPSAYKVVANIPYYLTSNLLRLLLESPQPPKAMSLMIQKEMAQRITAKPGKMSVLAASVQYYAEPVLVQEVSRLAFKPSPSVDSAIVQIKLRKHPIFAANAKLLFRIIKAGFGSRRKQLKNSLAGGLQITEQVATSMLKSAGLNPKQRAQELSLQDWQKLYIVAENSKFL